MNKKTIYISLAIIVLLVGYIIYLYQTDNPVSIEKPNSDFAFENPEIIDKIVIRDITNEVAELTKKEDTWYVNDNFKARPENIDLILTTVKEIRVQRSVPKESIKHVIRDIATTHKKVDFFSNGKLLKTYFIGNPTQDHYGTFMLLETPTEGRSTVPYVTHIPGFNGFLSTRFFSSENLWKFSGVFNYDISQIAEIKVDHFPNTQESFLLKNVDTTFILVSATGNNVNGNQSLIKNYVLNYQKIHYNMVMEYPQHQIDSVKRLTPNWSVSITDKNNKINQLKIYKMAAPIGNTDPVTHKQREFDVNHALACFNDANEILKFQYYTLDKILVEKSFLQQ